MRARTLAWGVFETAVALAAALVPVASAHAEIALIPSVDSSPAIPAAAPGIYESAYKPGDSVQVMVRSLDPDLQVSADLSAIGVSTTTVSAAYGPYYGPIYGTFYPNTYAYYIGPFTIGAVTDGSKGITFSAMDSSGDATSTELALDIDTAAPRVSISNIAFSTTTPGEGDYVYVSGTFDGTGSTLTLGRPVVRVSDGNGADVSGCGGPVSLNPDALWSAIASSTDGTFTHVPVQLWECGNVGYMASHDAEAFTVSLDGYDGAGNTAHTELTVPYPHPVPALAGVSNVLFLPGIEGSRLYDDANCATGIEEKLWEPYDSLAGVFLGAGDAKVNKLTLTASGESKCANVYTKPGDVLDSIGGSAFYQPFIDQMNALEASGIMADWEAGAYDWRLSLDDLLSKGRETNGKVNYGQATSTPYLEQELLRLAADSKTGKVTIIAHSNGGLLAKALMQRLQAEGRGDLVDRIIMVAVPQTGAPLTVGSLLVGLNAGIYKDSVPIVSDAAARTLALNSPMTYHLLPSEDYLESALDPNHPVVEFSGSAYAKEESAYGSTIRNRSALDDFILAAGKTRAQAAAADLSSLAVGNSALVDYANRIHASLDSWTPPAGVEVDQIAGWGVDSTIAGVDFYTLNRAVPAGPIFATQPVREYRPIFTEDGDGTVPVPSALAMGESENVKRYWLDLTNAGIKHSSIFNDSDLRAFIGGILSGTATSTIQNISTSAPSRSNQKHLIFILHSPLTLQLSDSSDHTTGMNMNGAVSEGIPGAEYGTFGETQYLIAPAGQNYSLSMAGTGSGTFSLDIDESVAGALIATSTVANVPVATSTTAHMTISNGIASASALSIDENGDGKADFSIVPAAGTTTSFESNVDSLAYAAYIQQAVAGLHLNAPVARQLDAKLQNLVHLLKLDNRWDADDEDARIAMRKGDVLKTLALLKISQIEAYVKVQEALAQLPGILGRLLGKAKQGIEPQDGTNILAMMEELKSLVSQKP